MAPRSPSSWETPRSLIYPAGEGDDWGEGYQLLLGAERLVSGDDRLFIFSRRGAAETWGVRLLSWETDSDVDSVPDGIDNCPSVPNPDQADLDGDGQGDACDSDIDGDGFENAMDAFPYDPTEWEDTDGDGIGNNADADDDNDGVLDGDDIDPLDPNIGAVLLPVAKTDVLDPVQPGSQLTYTFYYANDGASTQTASNVELMESYDPNVSFASASPMPTIGDNVWTITDPSATTPLSSMWRITMSPAPESTESGCRSTTKTATR
jgi:hypothetical protein